MLYSELVRGSVYFLERTRQLRRFKSKRLCARRLANIRPKRSPSSARYARLGGGSSFLITRRSIGYWFATLCQRPENEQRDKPQTEVNLGSPPTTVPYTYHEAGPAHREAGPAHREAGPASWGTGAGSSNANDAGWQGFGSGTGGGGAFGP